MHISLEQFNLMLRQDIDEQERVRLADHILECDTCSRRFRMLNDLHSQMEVLQSDRKSTAARVFTMPVVRYGLGVAAVMAMALYPYISPGNLDAGLPAAPAVAQVETSAHQEEIFSILEEVHRINYQEAISKWGEDTTLVDILELHAGK